MGCDSELESDSSSSGPTAVAAPTWVEALIAMDAKTLEAAFKKTFSCYPYDANYKVNSGYGSITEIKIPKDVKKALNDEHFGTCWRLAMEAELKAKFAADFNFHYKKTFPQCRRVMKGTWIFSTKSDTHAANIIFMAR